METQITTGQKTTRTIISPASSKWRSRWLTLSAAFHQLQKKWKRKKTGVITWMYTIGCLISYFQVRSVFDPFSISFQSVSHHFRWVFEQFSINFRPVPDPFPMSFEQLFSSNLEQVLNNSDQIFKPFPMSFQTFRTFSIPRFRRPHPFPLHRSQIWHHDSHSVRQRSHLSWTLGSPAGAGSFYSFLGQSPRHTERSIQCIDRSFRPTSTSFTTCRWTGQQHSAGASLSTCGATDHKYIGSISWRIGWTTLGHQPDPPANKEFSFESGFGCDLGFGFPMS